jgi:hypothetical protein
MEDSFSLAHRRMDWDFGNPNKTATLITLIMIAVWGLCYIWKRGFWMALGLFIGFGTCLILTQSRGGLIGAIVGELIVLAWIPRPYPLSRSLAVAGSCVALIILALVLNTETRITKGFSGEDLSIKNRLLIWEQVPAMVHDAPNGWGLGKSGDAYMQWYQPITRGEGYRTLVNSHLTWLAEFNWWGRIAYVTSWGFIFILLWPCSKHRWFSIPFALWIAFGICASFSSVAEAPILWIIPLTALIQVLMTRFQEKNWPRPGAWVAVAVALTVVMGGARLWKSNAASSSIFCPHAGTVTICSASPKLWLISPDKAVLGEHYGHEIRRGFADETIFKQMGLGIASELKNVPQNQIVIFSGPVPATFAASNPARIILINPEPVTEDLIQALARFPKVTVIVGEYSRNKNYWSEQAGLHSNIKCQISQGSEDYLSKWMHDLASAVKS